MVKTVKMAKQGKRKASKEIVPRFFYVLLVTFYSFYSFHLLNAHSACLDSIGFSVRHNNKSESGIPPLEADTTVDWTDI